MTAAPQKNKELHGFRSMLELAICFVITVSMLRGFFLEGYLVSTGSMAPILLGFHKQIECPSCQYSFACGVRFDESAHGGSVAADSLSHGNAYASCPNCGQINIDISPVPLNHGDQLLVHKNVFDFRRPRRWEPVVFCNPVSAAEAYVKRVVGLPGERLLISDGDVYINGQIARKSLTTQRSMRILISDLSHVPDDPDWELPWQLDGNWTVHDGELRCSVNGDSSDDQTSTNSLSFRHWRWFGGDHTVETPLSKQDAYPDWTDFLQRFDNIPVSWARRLDFDEDTQVLRCQGVMPVEMQRDLMSSATNEVFRRAIYRLAALSHLSPVTDHYGYNSAVASAENGVADLMLQTTISIDDRPAWMTVSIPVDSDVYHIRLDMNSGDVSLFAEGTQDPLRHGTADLKGSQLEIEASNFDRRLLFAINGSAAFAPLDLPGPQAVLPSESSGEAAVPLGAAAAESTAEHVRRQQRFRLRITGGRARVGDLRMYRDVYYTPGRHKHAVESTCEIAADSYFVQGDNSPVSYDSRSWENPFVPHHLLVGKPFVVHLPSRPGRLRLGSREISIRIPDFTRIRYIQ
jgi:signal peptidase I